MNLDKNTLVLLGRAKSGTTTTWAFLNSHPQIHSSIIKEPLDCMKRDLKHISKKEYLKNWYIENIKNGDVLLDGSTLWWRFIMLKHCGILNLFNELDFKNMYCLFVIRRPYLTWLRSSLQLFLKVAQNESNVSQFMNKFGYLNLVEIEKLIYEGHRKELQLIENIIGRKNIIVTELHNLEKNQSKIYDFLGVDSSYVAITDHKNKTPSKQKRNVKSRNIYLYLKAAKPLIEQQEKRDMNIIKKKYNFIGDV